MLQSRAPTGQMFPYAVRHDLDLDPSSALVEAIRPCHRDAEPFREPSRRRPVLEEADRLARRADEHDPSELTRLREPVVLDLRAPADPERVRPGGAQRSHEQLGVEIGARSRGAGGDRGAAGVGSGSRVQAHVLVGLPDEPGPRVGHVVDRNGRDRSQGLAGPVELGDGVDGAHGRLATVHDGQSVEFGHALAPS